MQSSKIDRIKDLVEQLNAASESYYAKDQEIMSNYEYDKLYDELVELEKETGVTLANSPTVNVGYEAVDELPKERHESPMLSLGKTKSREELRDWLQGNPAILSWKLDGLTIVLTYREGKLAKAVTRGNGEIGEVITNNARTFKNLPLNISYTGELILRGEAVITYSDFEKINGEIADAEAKYKNPRNLCSGSVRQLNNEITAKRNVRFYAFTLVKADDVDFHDSKEAQFAFLQEQGFAVVEHVAVTEENILSAIEDFEHKIIYYETSRGCPFSCSYCLSSVDKRLRFRDIELVKKELQFFLDRKVPQVKFVDRTFNCKKSHSMAIWQYLLEHDNGITNFHFEISSDLLDDDELALMKQMRPGLIQLEIGVQTTNLVVVKEIRRTMDLDKVAHRVAQVNAFGNIHQHLDLIAGLPYEDYDSFRRSFADVYALRPQQLQLGFLKVLRGSFMYEHTEEYDCHYQEREPYEVLYTKWLPYDDVLKLKDVEEMVEVYYNSGQFVHTLPMIERLYENPFDFFQELGDFYRAKGYSEAAHNRIQRYEILLEFLQDEKQQDEAFFRQMMVLDLYARENMKTRPHFAKDPSEWKNESRDFYQKEAETRTLLPSYTTYDWKQLQRMTHVEVFDYDVLGNGEKARTVLLFDYQKRDPLTGNAELIDCSEFFYA